MRSPPAEPAVAPAAIAIETVSPTTLRAAYVKLIVSPQRESLLSSAYLDAGSAWRRERTGCPGDPRECDCLLGRPHPFERNSRSITTGVPPTTTRVQAFPCPIAYFTVGKDDSYSDKHFAHTVSPSSVGRHGQHLRRPRCLDHFWTVTICDWPQ